MRFILAAYRRAKGQQSEAARLLGISRNALGTGWKRSAFATNTLTNPSRIGSMLAAHRN